MPDLISGAVAGRGFHLTEGVMPGRNVVGQIGVSPLNRNLTVLLAEPLLMHALTVGATFAIRFSLDEKFGIGDSVAVLVNFAEGALIRFILVVHEGLAGDESSFLFCVVSLKFQLHRIGIGVQLTAGRWHKFLDINSFRGFTGG